MGHLKGVEGRRVAIKTKGIPGESINELKMELSLDIHSPRTCQLHADVMVVMVVG